MSYFDDVIEPRLYKPIHLNNKRVEKFQIPDLTWIMKNDQKILISDMENGHLVNCHTLVGRRLGTKDEREMDVIYYPALKIEMNKRFL